MTEQVKIALASTSLTAGTGLLHKPEWLGEFAQEAGYDGIEWHPTVHSPRHVAAAVNSGALTVVSLHASSRTNEVSRGIELDPYAQRGWRQRLLDGPLGRLVMPETVASARWMQQLQRGIGTTLPAVFYPQLHADVDQQMLASAQARRNLLRPSDHVARLTGAETPDALGAEMRRRGYQGYCIDTVDVRRRDGTEQTGVVSDLERSLPALAVQARAVRVSLNDQRAVQGEPNIPSQQELRETLQGVYRGELRSILDAVRAPGRIDYAVVALTTGALAEVTGVRRREDFVAAYRDIGSGLRAYFDSASGSPSAAS